MLKQIMNETGIYVSLQPYIEGSSIPALFYKYKNEYNALIITDKYKTIDHFINYFYQAVFFMIEGEETFKIDSNESRQYADKWINDIMPAYNDSIIDKGYLEKIGNEHNIDISMIIGDLERKNIIDYKQYYNLKTKIDFTGLV